MGGRRRRKEEDKWEKNKEAENGQQEEEEVHFISEENEVCNMFWNTACNQVRHAFLKKKVKGLFGFTTSVIQSIVAGKIWWQKQGEYGHVTSTVEEKRIITVCVHPIFYFMCSGRPQSMECPHPHLEVFSFCSSHHLYNPLQLCPETCLLGNSASFQVNK